MALTQQSKWMVTGVAGFIGANCLKKLLLLDQVVVGVDNFSAGKEENLAQVEALVSPQQWQRFQLIRADIADTTAIKQAMRDIDYVLHQAALCSVPLSIDDPLRANQDNITGFVNVLCAASDAGVKRVVYASSSAVYGDCETIPATETEIGKPLSPYALTKYVDECYADVFARCYGLETIGLRYFNVFGPMQAPDSAYAAVIPGWINAMLENKPVIINGDGKNTRDFCFVGNIVEANLLAATCQNAKAVNQVYNIALGQQTSLLELFDLLKSLMGDFNERAAVIEPSYGDFRQGDVRFSQADISSAQKALGFNPQCAVLAGLKETIAWYAAQLTARQNPQTT